MYVIGFLGPGAGTKVGSTASPWDRLLTHYYTGKSNGREVDGIWLSPAHPDFRILEKKVLQKCRLLCPQASPRSEYFHGMPFEQARLEAARAYGRGNIIAPTYLHDGAAAGGDEALSGHIRRRLQKAPSVADAFVVDDALRQRFQQGSARTRFLRRNDPAESLGALLRLFQ